MGRNGKSGKDREPGDGQAVATPKTKVPMIDHHRICYRTIRYFIYKYSLPYDFTPEKDVNDHERRCDIILTRKKGKKDGKLPFNACGTIVGEFKNYHRNANIRDFLQLQHYAMGECIEHSTERNEGDRGVAAMLLCRGIGRSMRRHLKRFGFGLEKKKDGIYNVSGVPGIPDFRIIVLRDLAGDEYACFRIIGDNAKKEDIVRFLMETEKFRDDDVAWPWIDEIRGACLQVNNKEYIKAIEEVEKMNQFEREYYERNCWTGRERQIQEAVRDARKQAFADGKEKGEKRGEKRGKAKAVSDIMAMCKDGVVTMEKLLAYQAGLEKSAGMSA